jgi:ABC-type proline/glycine betaine transport system substrate-binding protein
MQQCSDIDLKMSLISSQENQLQDLSNQNASLQKVLEKFNYKVELHTLSYLLNWQKLNFIKKKN